MKRIFFYLFPVFLAVTLASCVREPGDMPVGGEGGPANVYFQIGLDTKASAEPSDGALGNVEVLLFDEESGALEAARSVNFNGDSSGAVELNDVRLGRTYVCRVVANVRNASGAAVSFSGASSVDDVDDYVLSLPAYSGNRIPMWGTTPGGTVTFSSASKTASVVLTRAASRIRVTKVTANFPDHIKTKSASVTGIYIYNAPGRYNLGLTAPDSNVYYHVSGFSNTDDSVLGSFSPYVGERITSNNVISGNGTFSSPRWFMVCPHEAFYPSVPEDATYITIEVTIDGTPYYYGIPLTDAASNPDGLLPNYQYVISNVKLTDYGNTEPPGLIDKDAISVSISVDPWHNGFDKEVDF